MSIKLLALDLDGTITADFKTIMPEVSQAIKETIAKGVYVTLATGREYKATLPFAETLGISAPLICYQGGLVKDHRRGETLFTQTMPATLSRQVIKYARARKMHLVMYLDEAVFTELPSEQMFEFFEAIGNPITVINNLLGLINDLDEQALPLKFLVINTSKRSDKIMKALKDEFELSLSIFKSHSTLVEATLPTVSKGQALRYLADYYQIKPDEMMVVGDQDNDISMLQMAGISVAMGNASPGAKNVAQVIAPSIEDAGVAWAINQYILT